TRTPRTRAASPRRSERRAAEPSRTLTSAAPGSPNAASRGQNRESAARVSARDHPSRSRQRWRPEKQPNKQPAPTPEPWRPAGPRAHQAALVGQYHQAGAVTGIGLRQDPADVGPGGGRAQEEFPGDLVVGQPAAYSGEYLALAVGQILQRALVGRHLPLLRSRAHQRPGSRWGEDRIAGRHCADGLSQLPR